jgi:hypothetical protein
MGWHDRALLQDRNHPHVAGKGGHGHSRCWRRTWAETRQPRSLARCCYRPTAARHDDTHNRHQHAWTFLYSAGHWERGPAIGGNRSSATQLRASLPDIGCRQYDSNHFPKEWQRLTGGQAVGNPSPRLARLGPKNWQQPAFGLMAGLWGRDGNTTDGACRLVQRSGRPA